MDINKDLIIRIYTPGKDGQAPALIHEHTVDPACDLDLDGNTAHWVMVQVMDSLRLGASCMKMRAKLEAQKAADKLVLGGGK